MRGEPEAARQMFPYVGIEDGIAADYPLRAIRSLAEEVLGWRSIMGRLVAMLHPPGSAGLKRPDDTSSVT